MKDSSLISITLESNLIRRLAIKIVVMKNRITDIDFSDAHRDFPISTNGLYSIEV